MAAAQLILNTVARVHGVYPGRGPLLGRWRSLGPRPGALSGDGCRGREDP